MARINLPVFTFKAGVLSRKLLGRAELDLYRNSLLVGENFITHVHGPAEFRGGFEYITPTRDNQIACLIPFIFNDNEAYILSLTENKIRFFTVDGVITETAKTITGITQANPGVITSNGHSFDDGDEVYISGVVGMTELNGKFFLVDNSAANTFTLTDIDGNAIDTSAYTAYVSGGTAERVYEIDSPYTEDEFFQLKYAQKADLMLSTHSNHVPRNLTRAGATDWTLATFTRTNDPFGQSEITAITQANPGQVTTGANHGFSNGDEVLIEDVGGMTEVNNEIFTITVVNPTTYTIGVSTSGYSAYTSGGVSILSGNCPAAVGIYGGRAFYGGSENDPELFNGSRSPDTSTGAIRYTDFTTGANADDAVVFALSSQNNTADRIRFFLGTREFLSIGTFGGMYKANGGSDTIAISGTAINTYPIDAIGCADIMPIRFGTDIFYAQRNLKTLSGFKYNILNEGFESTDENLRSDEILYDGLKQIAYQRGRPEMIWVCTVDGRLLSFTYSSTEELSAWMEHKIGGEDVKVLSVATLPQSNGYDRVVIVVERTIDGVTRRYIEYSTVDPRIPEKADYYTSDEDTDEVEYEDAMYETQKTIVRLDSALYLDTTQQVTITPSAITGTAVTFTAGASLFVSSDVGREIVVKKIVGGENGVARILSVDSDTEVTCYIRQDFLSTDAIAAGGWFLTKDEVTGLDHLEGQAVKALVDGGVVSGLTVEDGAVNVGRSGTYIIVGLPYRGRLKPFPLDIISSNITTIGYKKTISNFKFLFRNSLGVSYGIDPYNLKRLSFGKVIDVLDRPPLLYTGYKESPGFSDYEYLIEYNIVQDTPLPCTVLAVIADLEVEFNM